jgi:hypothetical protein
MAIQSASSPSTASPKLLVVGFPRGGTSLIAQYLASLGLETVPDARGEPDYPSGYMEHLPCLLFTKACERLRGRRDRLTEESLIEDRYLDIPCMRAMFQEAYRPFHDPEVDFVKLPDHTLALDFMRRRFPELRFLGVWREPREAIASYRRREFGRHPGVRGLFYAIGAWNMYTRRMIDFKERHPHLIDLVNVDAFVSGNGSLSGLLRQRGFRLARDHGVRDVLTREWGGGPGVLGGGLALCEATFRRVAPATQKVYFASSVHRERIRRLSVRDG